MSLLDEFYASLGASSQIEFHEKFMPAQYQGKLYHYTSPAGLISILFGDLKAMTLWASRCDTQNDALEGKVAIEVYKKVCAEIDSAENIDLSTIMPTRTLLMQSKVNGKIKTARPECESFICCFSQSQDSLPMWNYYSKGNSYEGYNIGVDIDKLKDSLLQSYRDLEVSSKIYPVIYDDVEQKNLVESFMRAVLSKYDPKHDTSVRYAISNQLAMWQLLFKSKYFEHEKEVRVIISVAKPTSTKKSPVDIKYRANGMYIIPYIEMKIDKNCMTSIMFGPQQWHEKQKKQQTEIIKDTLWRNGYSGDVTHSKAPIKY